MSVTNTEISKYSVSVITFAEPNGMMATLSLFNSTGKPIAFLKFYSPENTPAANRWRADLGLAEISYPSSSLQPIVDILRNEKPVYFTWYDYMPVRCFGAVGTSREAIGEGEE